MSIEELAKKHCARWVSNRGISWTDTIRNALTEQAETHALELRAYEATVANLEQRIRELEQERVPEGWKLVPIEATQEMLKESGLYDDDTIEVNSAASMAGQIYRAMLAAAPKKEGECVHRFMYFGDQPNRRCADCNAIEGAAPKKGDSNEA